MSAAAIFSILHVNLVNHDSKLVIVLCADSY